MAIYFVLSIWINGQIDFNNMSALEAWELGLVRLNSFGLRAKDLVLEKTGAHRVPSGYVKIDMENHHF